MPKIAVIGSGGWGTAIAIMLNKKGNDVTLWSYTKEESDNLIKNGENVPFLPGVKLSDEIMCTSDLKKAVWGADIIVNATPSFAVRSTMKQLKEYYKGNQIIVNISKGLEQGSFLTLSGVIKEEIENAKCVVMSGPSHAEEVSRNIPTTNVVASDDPKIAEYIQSVFMFETFRVYTNTDVLGVEIAASIKNVIALCAGIIDGVGYGDNTKAALITRGIVEIARLGVAMGADLKTFYGLAGIGDLIVTCTSMHSRNRRCGILLGEGKTLTEALDEINMTVEGVKTTVAAYELSKRVGVEMPIVNEAYKVLFENKAPKQAVTDLMLRDKTYEYEDWC